MEILELKSIVYELKKKILGWAYQQIGASWRNSGHEDRATEIQSEEIRRVKRGDPTNSLPTIPATGVSGENNKAEETKK